MFERKSHVHKLEAQLKGLVMKIYDLNSGGRRFYPRHPYVLVRVLPKEQKTDGGIWLAEASQNKPQYEGIVITTWQPYDREDKVKCDCGCGHYATRTVHFECSLKPGDRVVFPHYEGLPLGDWLDDRYYRVVHEGTDPAQWANCNVLGTLDYEGDEKIAAQIRELTKQMASITTSGLPMARGSQ